MGYLPLTSYVARQVVTLAREVREAQTSTSTSRSGGMLQLSKRLEARLDRLLRSIDLNAPTGGLEVDGAFPSSAEAVAEFYREHPEFVAPGVAMAPDGAPAR